MTDAVAVQNPHAYSVDSARLRQAAQTVLARQNADAASSLTIVITTDAAVQSLNLQHRGVDAPTDVLSFPADPLPPQLRDDNTLYLGDLVIAFPYAQAQAEREDHPLGDSLALLVVHGTLHLLGYDHDTAANRPAMWRAQADALRVLGIDEGIVPALEDSGHA